LSLSEGGSSEEEREERLRKYQVRKEQSAGTRNSLSYDAKAWYLERAEYTLTGSVFPLKETRAWLAINLPSIGLAPCWVSATDANPFHMHESLFEGFESATFRQRVENGLPSLSAEYGGGRRLTWRFDDRYGGKPVWAGFAITGAPVYYSETEYQQIGERWFPESVRFDKGDNCPSRR